MANTIPSRLSIVGKVRVGQLVEARWIVGHAMETGFRVDDAGRPIARNIVTQVRVLLNDKAILEFEPGTGLSAQPLLAFSVLVPPGGGRLVVEWSDDRGDGGRVQQLLLPEP